MEKKILVIDDEELVTRSLLKLLKKQGFFVAVAKSGLEALEKVKKIDFDLIISDVRMPEMDGFQTIKKIREHCEKNNKNLIPEVLITGYADADKYENATELEVVDFLYKPFDCDDFLKIVTKNIR